MGGSVDSIRRWSIVVTSLRVNGVSASVVWLAAAGHGVLKSGRNVSSVRIASRWLREHELLQELERRGVDPLQVLDDEQHGSVRGIRAEPVTDGRERGFPLASGESVTAL